MKSVGFDQHDHGSCIATGVEIAEAQCKAAGLKLTPVRKRVLEILLSEHRAMGAYDILERLRADGFASQPPVAYRALDFLVANGFAHRVERLNAFVACDRPSEAHAPAFLICRVCDAVAEANAPHAKGPLAKSARDAGFEIETDYAFPSGPPSRTSRGIVARKV